MRSEHLAGLLAAILAGGACAPTSAFMIYPLGPGDAQIEGLFLHEIGHAIGLGHTDDVTAVMCGFIWPDINPACDYQHLNRIPEPDDVAGITTLYGAVPTPGTGFFLWFGLAGFMAKTGRGRGRRRRRSRKAAIRTHKPVARAA